MVKYFNIIIKYINILILSYKWKGVRKKSFYYKMLN